MRRSHNMMAGRSNYQLKDLDRELDLLRKKRQLLAQEQEFYRTVSYKPHPISPWENPPQLNDYGNQQSYDSPSYVDLYDSARPEGRRRPRKRPAKRWQEEPPKRFRLDSRPDDHPPKRYPSGPPKKFGPPPPKKINSQPPIKFGSQPPRNFPADPKAPPKSQGPKKPYKGPAAAGSARASGSKPKNQGASTAPAHATPSKYKFTEPYIFTNKKQAPRKILGRLEFALGVIFKEMHSRFADHQNRSLFNYETNLAGVKNLKKALRERIYEALQDKEIGDVPNIMEKYRAMYPETTDEDLLQSVADAEQELRTIEEKLLKENPDSFYIKAAIEADTAEEFFSINMKSVLRNTMDEMFGKLQKLYEDEYKANQPTEPEESKEAADPEESKEAADPEEIKEAADPENKEAADPEENKEAADPEENKEAADTEESKEAAEPEESKEEAEAPSEKYDPAIPTDSGVEKMKSYQTLMDGLIRKQLPKLLPEFKEVLINTMNLDQEFIKAKNYIYGHTSVKFRGTVASKKRVKWGQLYFVLIQGNPTLPKKTRLQTFIRHFNPTVIKKHKTIHNILYIGFMEKKDFDEILKENETHLDGSQLLIKETNKFHKSEMTMSERAEVKTELTETDRESLNAKLDKEIEDNIEELLTSIRNEQDVQNNKVIAESASDDDVQLIDNTEPVIELDTTKLHAKDVSNADEPNNGDELNEGDEPNTDQLNEGDEPNNEELNEGDKPNNDELNEGGEPNNDELNEGNEPNNDELNKDDEPSTDQEINKGDEPSNGNETNDKTNTGDESQTGEAGKIEQKTQHKELVSAKKVGSANSPSVVTRRSSRLHN